MALCSAKSEKVVNTNIITPWISQRSPKSKAYCLPMLEPKSLIDLFKCMGTDCSFTTNDRADMQKHLYRHVASLDVLSCSYCTTTGEHIGNLIDHIEDIHGKCKFQCRFCFYRAIEEGHVFHHQLYHHSGLTMQEHTIITVRANRLQQALNCMTGFVKLFQAKFKALDCSVCHSTYDTIRLFAGHMNTHEIGNIRCPVCRTTVDRSLLQGHLILHRTESFHCLYCEAKCNSCLEMHRHLSDNHCCKAAFCGVKMERLWRRYDIFVLYKLKMEVPAERLIASCLVDDGLLSATVKQTDQTDLPKIVEVQGGTQMHEDGSKGDGSRPTAAPAVAMESSDIAGNADGTAMVKPLYNRIRVKDFGFTKFGPLSTQPSDDLGERKRVKLKRLEDGSLILNLPSTSKAASTSASEYTSAIPPVSCTISKLNRIKPVSSLAGTSGQELVHSKEAQNTKYDVPERSGGPLLQVGVLSKNSSSRSPVYGDKMLRDNNCATSCERISGSTETHRKDKVTSLSKIFKTIDNKKQNIVHGDTAHSLTLEKSSSRRLPAYGDRASVETDRFGHASSVSSTSSPISTNDKRIDSYHRQPSSTAISHDVEDDEDDDGDDYTRNDVQATSKEIRNITFHLTEFQDKIDLYASSLDALVARRPFSGVDFFVCGVSDCTERFPNPNLLTKHMRKHYGGHTVPLIMCKLCNRTKKGIDPYVTHLNLHALNKFVCFLCSFNHFLLKTIVDHMEETHSCTALRLSFVHPQRVNLLKDIIVVLAVGLNNVDIEKHIERSIAEETEPIVDAHLLPFLNQSDSIGLYTCGFCRAVMTNKIAFKQHIWLCEERCSPQYTCAHCGQIYNNWSQEVDHIVQHLYFHGENLYKCSECIYAHFMRSRVAHHLEQHDRDGKSVLTVRESKTEWKCSICPYQSNFEQGVREHVQNTHNLPGERFMCALCDSRAFTESQSLSHCHNHHDGKNVAVIEMYHSAEANSKHKTKTDAPSHKGESIYAKISQDVSFVNVNDLDAKQLEPLETEEHQNLNSGQNDANVEGLCSTAAVMDDSYVLNESRANEINPKHTGRLQNDAITTLPETRKRKRECQDMGHLPKTSPDEEEMIVNEQSVDDLALYNVLESAEIDLLVHEKLKEKEIFIETETKNNKQNLDSSVLWEESPSPSKQIQRRKSKRVAVKTDTGERWKESTKYSCHSCKMYFESFGDFEEHWRNQNNRQNKVCLQVEIKRKNIHPFRLVKLLRCFYCNEQNTNAALRLHCREKHPTKQFVCIDYWDLFLCGLCSYRNGSGNDSEFAQHFMSCHATTREKCVSYEYITDTYLIWALSLGGNKPIEGSCPEVMKYICNHCNEMVGDAVCMGSHVAKHVLKFVCPRCPKEFKHLKVLYGHVIATHRMQDLVVSPTNLDDNDQHLLEVELLFKNGLVLSKREVQHTNIASLEELRAGFKMHYYEQLNDLETYKQNLTSPFDGV